MRLLVTEPDGITEAAAAELRKHCDVGHALVGNSKNLPVAVQRMSPDALWVRLRHRVDAEVFDAAPSIRYVVSPTTGTDHIDLEAAAARGIEVVTLKGETAFLETIPATAELTLALVLALTRRIIPAVDHTRSGGWDRYQFQGTDLKGKTVAVVGPGRVGMQVARLLRAFGCSVRLVREGDDLIEGIRHADIVTVHVPLSPTTEGMIYNQHFAAMKPGAFFVNTSRGAVVNESALLGALESGHLGGAALDVVEGEPDNRSCRLTAYTREHPEKLIITPHIGGFTHESLAAAELFAVRKLIDLLTKQPAVA